MVAECRFGRGVPLFGLGRRGRCGGDRARDGHGGGPQKVASIRFRHGIFREEGVLSEPEGVVTWPGVDGYPMRLARTGSRGTLGDARGNALLPAWRLAVGRCLKESVSKRGQRAGCPSPTRGESKASRYDVRESLNVGPTKGTSVVSDGVLRGTLSGEATPFDPGCRSTLGLSYGSRAGEELIELPASSAETLSQRRWPVAVCNRSTSGTRRRSTTNLSVDRYRDRGSRRVAFRMIRSSRRRDLAVHTPRTRRWTLLDLPDRADFIIRVVALPCVQSS